MTLLAWLVSSAFAQETTFEGTQKPPEAVEEKPLTQLSAELGGIAASGNTVGWAVTAGANGLHKWQLNQFKVLFSATTGRAIVDTNADAHLDDAERAAGLVETSRRASLDGRYDRFLGKRDSLYALAGGFTDPFAGYDHRVHGQLGYSHQFVASEKGTLLGEIGFDVAREDFVAGIDPNSQIVPAARVLLGASWTLNDRVSVTEQVEIYEGVVDLADLRIVNNAQLTTSLSGKLALKVAHLLTYDNVPVEGFRPLDQTSTVTLVASIL